MCAVTDDTEFMDVRYTDQETFGDVSAKVSVMADYYGVIDRGEMTGDCDITVPYLHSERLYEHLCEKTEADNTVFHLVPDMGHAACGLYTDEMLTELKNYLDEKLG